MPKTKILFVDIETAPNLGWTWRKWEQTVLDVVQDGYMLSFAWRWLGEKTTHVKALPDWASYKRDRTNDRKLAQALWDLFDEADIIVAHNGDSYDIKYANMRFLAHGFPPPSPYRSIDTRKLARKTFRFDSNALDDLGRYLGLGRKEEHIGFRLWERCMDGEPAAWQAMKSYNCRDIDLLVKVYYLLRAWANNHPNVNKGVEGCPKCGSPNVQRRGFSYTLLRRKQRYACMACRGWFEGPAEKGA